MNDEFYFLGGDMDRYRNAIASTPEERDTHWPVYRQLMDHSPDVIYFKDREHRFTRVNKAKAALVGEQDPER